MIAAARVIVIVVSSEAGVGSLERCGGVEEWTGGRPVKVVCGVGMDCILVLFVCIA